MGDYRTLFGQKTRFALLFVSLTAALVAGQLPAADKPAPKASDLRARQQQIAKTIAALHEIPLPRQLVTPEEVVSKVGKDPQKLSEYIRERIAYEPYRGFLKGPVGVLSSGRGNSADKSLLLLATLESAGVKARLVKGTIPADKVPQASLPKKEVADRAAALAAIKAAGVNVDELERNLKIAQLDKQKSIEELYQRVDRDLQTLAKALDDAKVPLPAQAAATTTEHWWVRTDGGDLDPTIAQASAKETGVFELKNVPAGDFHTLVFREVIVTGGKSQTVLEVKLRSADVFGKEISFANMAMDWQGKTKDSASPAETLAALKANRRLRAALCVDDKGYPGKMFDIDGNLIKEDGSPIGGAKDIGGGLGGMFGGMSGSEGEKPKSKLDECRLEVDIVSPGASAVTLRRALVRSPSSDSQKVYDLCTFYKFLALPEDVSEALISRKTTDSFEKIGQWLKDCGDKDPLADKGSSKIARLDGELWGFGLARRNEIERLGQTYCKAVFVHDRPTLAAVFGRMVEGERPKAVRGIDIFNNHMQAVGSGKAKSWSEHPALYLGVMDTALEHVSLGTTGGACQNASTLLERALVSGKAPVVLKDVKSASVSGESAKKQMADHLKGAVLVEIPGEVVSWYRVELGSGATLGYVENGGGQAAVEHIEDSALLWMVYEYLNIYCKAVRCLGMGFAMAISMDPEEQRKEFAVCTCVVALEAATSVASFAKEADPHGLLDWAEFVPAAYGWGQLVDKICEKAFEGGEGGHGEGGHGGGGGE